MNDNKKGNTVLLTVIAVATLLVAVVGATFAYFTASVAGNDTASSIIVKTAEIGTIVYENGTEVKLENAYPGATTAEMTFTVAADAKATANVNYTVNWANVTNGFAVKEDLVYTLKSEITTAGTKGTGTLVPAKTAAVAPSTSATPISIGNGTLTPGETHTYKLQLHFKETGADQNSNQGKEFIGKIEVSTSDNAYYTDQAQNGTSTAPEAEE